MLVALAVLVVLVLLVPVVLVLPGLLATAGAGRRLGAALPRGLETLYVCECSATERAKKALRRALPDTRIRSPVLASYIIQK